MRAIDDVHFEHSRVFKHVNVTYSRMRNKDLSPFTKDFRGGEHLNESID